MLDIDFTRARDHVHARPAFALAVEAVAMRAVLDDVCVFVDALMVDALAGGPDEELASAVLEALVAVRLRIATGVLVATDIVETMR